MKLVINIYQNNSVLRVDLKKNSIGNEPKEVTYLYTGLCSIEKIFRCHQTMSRS